MDIIASLISSIRSALFAIAVCVLLAGAKALSAFHSVFRQFRTVAFSITVFLFVAALHAIPGCKTTSTPPVVTHVVADCGVPAVRDLATHLLDDVASALVVDGDWRSALRAVASRAGADGLAAVNCAVQELLAQSQAQLAARAQMAPATAARIDATVTRAEAWLAEAGR